MGYVPRFSSSIALAGVLLTSLAVAPRHTVTHAASDAQTLFVANYEWDGNLDPAVLLGPKEKIRKTTLDIVDELGGVGHILNLGHGILQHTSVENAQLFIHTGQQAALSDARQVAQSRC